MGLERSTALGFGFIFEYQEDGPFSMNSIQEAQTYSSLFTLLVSELVLARAYDPA
jgi:hypothetical protein